MKRTISLSIAALIVVAALCITTSAHAGAQRLSASKEYAPAPVVEEPFSWTGFYIGGNLGGNWSNYEFSNYFVDVDLITQFEELELSLNGNSNTSGIIGNNGFASFVLPGTGPVGTGFDVGSDDGFIGGGQLGFQKQFGHFVIGLEGDFQRAAGSSSTLFTATHTTPADEEGFVITDITSARRAEVDWQASGRAKLGWANGHVMFYVTGGVAWANVDVTATDTARSEFFEFVFPDGGTTSGVGGGISTPVASSFGAISDTAFSRREETYLGWTGGGGGDYAINDMFSISMEYRHSDFGSHTFTFPTPSGVEFPAIRSGPMKVDLQSDMVVVKFNILLNHFFGH